MLKVLRAIRMVVKWTLLVAVVLGGIAYVVIQQRLNTEVHRHILAELRATYPHARVELGGVQLLDAKGIVIRNIALYDPAAKSSASRDDVPILAIEEVFLDCPTSLTAMLRRDVTIHRATIRKPRLRISLTADGSVRETPILTGRKSPQKREFAVQILDGTIVYTDDLLGDDRELKLDTINLACQPPGSPIEALADPGVREEPPPLNGVASGAPATASPIRPWTFQGTAKGAYFRDLQVSGHFNPENLDWCCTGGIRQFEWFQELPRFLRLRESLGRSAGNEELLRILDSFAGRTDLDFTVLRDVDTPLGIRFEVNGVLSHGYVALSRLRKVFTELAGSFRVTDRSIEIGNFTAVNGSARIGIDYRQQGLTAIEKGTIRSSIRELEIENEIIEHIRPFFPEGVRNLIARFQVDGRADIDTTLEWDGTAWKPRTVDLRGRRAAFNDTGFPYHVGNLNGTLTFRDLPGRRPEIEYHFQTAKEESPVIRIDGKYTDIMSDPQGRTVVNGTGVPINAKLMHMLPEKQREIVASLHPKGTINAALELKTPSGDAPVEKRLTVALDNCEILYDKFRYPLREICGTIAMENDTWEFKDLVGRNESATITCKGHLLPIRRPAHDDVEQRAASSPSGSHLQPLGASTGTLPRYDPNQTALPVTDGVIPPVPSHSRNLPVAHGGTDSPDVPGISGASEGLDYKFMLWVDADGLPLDGMIQTAIPDQQRRELLRSLGAKGRVDLKATINYLPSSNKLALAFEAEPCPGLTLLPSLFPYQISVERGTIAYDYDGTVRIKDFEGKNKDTTFSTSLFCKFNPDGSWVFSLNPLIIDQLPPNRELLKALPANLQTLLEQIQLTGSINLGGFVEFSKAAHPTAPMRTTWGLATVLHRNSALLAFPVSNILGKLYLSGLGEDGALNVSGALDLHAATVNGFPLSDVTGLFSYDGRDNTIVLGESGPVPVYMPSLSVPVSRNNQPASAETGLLASGPHRPVYRGQIPERLVGAPGISPSVPSVGTTVFTPPPLDPSIFPRSRPPETQAAAPTHVFPIPFPAPSPSNVSAPFTLPLGLDVQERPPRTDLFNYYGNASTMGILGSTATGLPHASIPVATVKKRPITARVFGGAAELSGRVIADRTFSYNLHVRADKVELATLAAEMGSGSANVSGKVYCRANISGKGRKLETLGGQGRIILEEAYLYELPFMMRLLQVVSIGEPDNSAFSSADIGFRLQGKRAILDPVDFEGTVLSLTGRNGEMSLDTRTVDILLGARLGNRRSRIPLISELLGGVSDQMLGLRVEGPLAGPPTVTRVPLPTIREALRNTQLEETEDENAAGRQDGRLGPFPSPKRIITSP